MGFGFFEVGGSAQNINLYKPLLKNLQLSIRKKNILIPEDFLGEEKKRPNPFSINFAKRPAADGVFL